MTKLAEDIQKEPAQILGSLRYTLGPGRAALREGAKLIRGSRHVMLVGIGSSWHAAMAAEAIFAQNGQPAFLWDASEFLHFSQISPNSCVILLSRSGRSVEIVRLIEKCRASRAKIIGITNTPESPLALQGDLVLPMNAEFDHQVSISMYSVLAMIAALLASEAAGALDGLLTTLEDSITAANQKISQWMRQIDSSEWLAPNAPTYFLARGPSLSTAYEARLLWEEAAKAPASALPTGSFRHGPQEIIRPGIRIALWIDGEKMREEDMALARDLRMYGVQLLTIGQALSPRVGNLVLDVPSIPSSWQFLTDIIPIQIAAERLAQLRGENCDVFRVCSYIIETEGGLEHSH